MSAIGDYVHYKASNYIKYGTSKKSAGRGITGSDWLRIRTEMYNKIQKIYTDREILELQEQYNGARSLIAANDDKQAQMIRAALVNLVLKDNKDMRLNFKTGDVELTPQGTVKYLGSKINKIKSSSKEEVTKDLYSYEDTVIRRFTDAYNSLKEIQNVSNKKAIKAKLNSLMVAFQNIVAKEGKDAQELGVSGLNISKGKVISRKRAQEFIHTLRVAMGLDSAKMASNLKGKFDEYTAAAADLKARGLAFKTISEWEDEIQRAFDKNGGGKRVKSILSASNMSLNKKAVEEELQKHKNFVIKNKNGKYQFQLSESQQKMDASFSWEGGPAEGYRLSLKNYNLSSSHPISLVTKSPLSMFLFNIGKTDYVNHFLNIFAAHENATSQFRSMRAIAEEAFAYHLLYAAMSGKNLGRDSGSADVFVVNDTSSATGVKMYDIGTLVQNVIDKGQIFSGVDIDPALSSIYLKNEWEKNGKHIGENVQRRITKLLLDTHAKKMSVALRPSVLK